jgi:hypothetical protein
LHDAKEGRNVAKKAAGIYMAEPAMKQPLRAAPSAAEAASSVDAGELADAFEVGEE